METEAVVTPDIQNKLLSVRELTKHGKYIMFTHNCAYVIQKQKLICLKYFGLQKVAKWKHNAYTLQYPNYKFSHKN